MRDLWELLHPWRSRVLLALLAAIGAAMCSVALAGTAAWLIATAAGQVPVLTLMVAIVAVRACGVGRGVLRYAERLTGHDAVLRMLGEVRERAVLGLADRVRRGKLRPGDAAALTAVTADVDDLQDALLRGVLPYLSSAVVAIGATAACAVMLPAAGLVLGCCLLLAMVILPALTSSRVGRQLERALAARAERDVRLAEMLRGADDLLVTGRWDGAVARLSDADDAERRAREAQATATAGRSAVAVLATGIACWVAAVAGLAATGAGQLDPVLLAVITLVPPALTELVGDAGECTAALSRTMAARRRVSVLLTAAPDPDDEASGLPSDAARPAPGAGPVTVELHGVAARWPGSATDAIRGVDLCLRPGERTAVVGPSGSGKSTLVAVLLGMLPITAGRISVNGRPVAGDELAPLMSWVPAEPHLFDSTIDRNIRLGAPDATDEQVRAACAAAGLAGWIDRLPAGASTRVGPDALAVSGGERQRIAVARALLVDRPMLLADEPAAQLDGATADAVTAAVVRSVPSRAVLLVTHREQDLDAVDTVLRLPVGGQPASIVTRPPVTSDTAM